MPTQSTTYNTRLTDEALEKRFRDTFRSQGGAELVDDLYASGVIIPIVDFTQAAEGSQLPQLLQTAWDFTTGATQINNTTTDLISTSGFWQVDLTFATADQTGGSVATMATLTIFDGSTSKTVWGISNTLKAGTEGPGFAVENRFIVFLRPGDTLRGFSRSTAETLDVWYRQIATVSGDLINPSGFTSS